MDPQRLYVKVTRLGCLIKGQNKEKEEPWREWNGASKEEKKVIRNLEVFIE